MKTKSIEWWNSLKKNADTNTIAEEGDLVCLISGIAFLIQRHNDFNNVVCWKIKTTKKNLVLIFNEFRKFCEKNKIQYIRVEGIGKHTYRMLSLLFKYAPEGAGLIYAEEESKKLDRHIHYVKTY
jgi:hypothetical protein